MSPAPMSDEASDFDSDPELRAAGSRITRGKALMRLAGAVMVTNMVLAISLGWVSLTRWTEDSPPLGPQLVTLAAMLLWLFGWSRTVSGRRRTAERCRVLLDEYLASKKRSEA